MRCIIDWVGSSAYADRKTSGICKQSIDKNRGKLLSAGKRNACTCLRSKPLPPVHLRTSCYSGDWSPNLGSYSEEASCTSAKKTSKDDAGITTIWFDSCVQAGGRIVFGRYLVPCLPSFVQPSPWLRYNGACLSLWRRDGGWSRECHVRCLQHIRSAAARVGARYCSRSRNAATHSIDPVRMAKCTM